MKKHLMVGTIAAVVMSGVLLSGQEKPIAQGSEKKMVAKYNGDAMIEPFLESGRIGEGRQAVELAPRLISKREQCPILSYGRRSTAHSMGNLYSSQSGSTEFTKNKTKEILK